MERTKTPKHNSGFIIEREAIIERLCNEHGPLTTREFMEFFKDFGIHANKGEMNSWISMLRRKNKIKIIEKRDCLVTGNWTQCYSTNYKMRSQDGCTRHYKNRYQFQFSNRPI
jgi:hypothetical protein